MLKHIKRIIIICIVLAIVTIVAILVLLSKSESSTNVIVENNIVHENVVQIEENTDISLVKVTNRDTFYTAVSCVNKYLGYITSKNSNAVYSVLNAQYILKNNITKENVIEKVWKAESTQIFDASEMKFASKGNVNNFYVYGTARNDVMDEVSEEYELYIKINMDLKTRAFSVEEISKEQYNASKVELKELVENIEINDYNLFAMKTVTDKEMARTYLIKYKNLLLNNVEKAYSLLNKEYASIMFKDLESFRKYVSDNYNNILEISLNKYGVSNRNYTCIDKNDYYYIFKENGVMNYSVLFDEYTVVNAIQYNKKTNEEKAQYNVERFINFINFGNYESAYGLLNEQFRNNNFATVEQFKQYCISNLFARNKVDNVKVEIVDDLYTVSVDITDLDYNSDNKVSKTFIVKLQDKTCELSFNK